MKLLWLCVLLLCSCATDRGRVVAIFVVGDVEPTIQRVRASKGLTIQDIILMSGGILPESLGRVPSVILYRDPSNLDSGKIYIYGEDLRTPLSELGVDITRFQKLEVRGGRL